MKVDLGVVKVSERIRILKRLDHKPPKFDTRGLEQSKSHAGTTTGLRGVCCQTLGFTVFLTVGKRYIDQWPGDRA